MGARQPQGTGQQLQALGGAERLKGSGCCSLPLTLQLEAEQ